MIAEAELDLVRPASAATPEIAQLDELVLRQQALDTNPEIIPDQSRSYPFPTWWRRRGWERFWRWAEDRVELRARLRRTAERRTDELNGRRQIAVHELGVDAQRAIAEAAELFALPRRRLRA